MRRKRVGLKWLPFILAILGSFWLFPESAGAGAPPLVLTPTIDFNPIGTEHTLTAQINPATSGAKVFFQVGGVCSGGTDDGNACFPGQTTCSDGGGACVGPDFGEQFNCTTTCNGACLTTPGPDGQCTGSYTNTEGPGVNKIRACALTFLFVGSIDNYGDCADQEDSILSSDPASVTKYWLETFVTGGWTRGKGKTLSNSGAGTFGVDPKGDPGDVIGQYQMIDHVNNVACHFDTFRSLVLACSGGGGPPCAGSPVSTVNKVTVHMEGTCNQPCGGTVEGDLTLEDNGEPGKGVDKVSWTRTDGSCLASFCDPATSACTINGGNIQIHEGPKE